jgi:hypothetical protein
MRCLLICLLPLAGFAQGTFNGGPTYTGPPVLSSLKGASTLGTDSNGKLIVGGSSGCSYANVVVASCVSGVVLDATLGVPGSPGSGTQTCTGNAAKLLTAVSAVLGTYSSAVLLIDGPSCLEEGLAFPQGSNVTVQGTGPTSGFMPQSGCLCNVISNGWAIPTSAGSAATQAGSLILRDFSINGNLVNNAGSGQSCATGQSGCVGVFAFNVQYFEASHLVVFNYPSFGLLWANAGQAVVDYNTIIGPNALGSDPIHAAGPATRVSVVGNKVQAGDNCIAVNAPELMAGNISDFHIVDTEMVGLGCYSLVKVYNQEAGSSSNPCYTITGLVVENFSGVVQDTILDMTGSECSTPDMMQISVSHGNVTGTASIASVNGPWQGITIRDIVFAKSSFSFPGAYLVLNGAQVTDLDLEDIRYERTTSVPNTNLYPVEVTGSSSVAHLFMKNVGVVDESGQNFVGSEGLTPQLLDVDSGSSIGTLELAGPLNTNQKIGNLFSSGTYALITTVAGVENFYATPTAGCGTVAGTNSRGKITATSSVSSCTLTFGGGTLAAGWSCAFSDETSGVALPQTSDTATTAVATGTITSSDKVIYTCLPH